MRKGFLFTIDALASLAIMTVAFTVVIAFHQLDDLQSNSLASLGRDYLEQKYIQGSSIDANQFKQLTGFNASESPTQGVLVARASLFVYPSVFTGCNCTTTACRLSAGVNDSCFSSQENLNTSLKQVWVTAG